MSRFVLLAEHWESWQPLELAAGRGLELPATTSMAKRSSMDASPQGEGGDASPQGEAGNRKRWLS